MHRNDHIRRSAPATDLLYSLPVAHAYNCLLAIEEHLVLEGVEIHLLLDRDQPDRWNQHVIEVRYLHSATLADKSNEIPAAQKLIERAPIRPG